MFKKILMILAVVCLLFTTSCGGKLAQEGLAELVGNLLGIQNMTMMMHLYGMPLEGSVLEMNDEGTSADLVMENFSVKDMIIAMGYTEEDAVDLPIEEISGNVHVVESGNMEFDLTLTGAVCSSVSFVFEAETQKISDLVADGDSYDINKTLEKMSKEMAEEEAKAQAEAEAALPQVQTVQ